MTALESYDKLIIKLLNEGIAEDKSEWGLDEYGYINYALREKTLRLKEWNVPQYPLFCNTTGQEPDFTTKEGPILWGLFAANYARLYNKNGGIDLPTEADFDELFRESKNILKESGDRTPGLYLDLSYPETLSTTTIMFLSKRIAKLRGVKHPVPITESQDFYVPPGSTIEILM